MIIANIFSGIEILFFVLGALFTLLIVALIQYNKKYKFNWLAWTLYILASFFFLFTIAWSVSSVLEGEPRAGSMGLAFFGLISLILFALGRRVMVKKAKKVLSVSE